MPSSSSQDQRGETWRENYICFGKLRFFFIKNSLYTPLLFRIYNKRPFKRVQMHFYVPFLSRCSMLAPRAMRTDTSSSCPPAHASVSAVSWLLSVCGQRKKKPFNRIDSLIYAYQLIFFISILRVHFGKTDTETYMCVDVNRRIKGQD